MPVDPPALAAEGLVAALGDGPDCGPATLSLPRGGRGLIVGPSGSGKTTLLRALAGLARIRRGSIAIDGTPVTRERADLRRRVALVFQEPDPAGTVGETLRGPFAYGANRANTPDEDTFRTVLDALGLAAIALADDTASLSGGERHRVALAAALSLRRSVLLLDEPTAALDAAAADRVVSALDRHRSRDGGPAVLAVTHDPGGAFADWPVCLELDGVDREAAA